MHRIYLLLASLAAGIVAVALLGCGTSSPTTTNQSPPVDSNAALEEHDHAAADPDHGDHAAAGSGDMQKMAEGLATLSPTDRASAEQQHVCPVSGEMLGTMGAPVKVTVEGREVWLCCSGCEEQLRADPDKYLAKLNNQ